MKTMDHQQAVRMHAAERYLLEELNPEEREGFEEHYFMCIQCADEVRAAFVFKETARAVMMEQTPAPPKPIAKPNFWAWLKPSFAVPAMAALLLGVIYQSFIVIPRLERKLESATTARVVPSTVARAATRGDEAVVQISADDQFVQVILDINTLVPVSSYTCEVYEESGRLLFAVPAPVPTAAGSLNLLLPASGLITGRYEIKVRSNNPRSDSADSYTFAVQRK